VAFGWVEGCAPDVYYWRQEAWWAYGVRTP
jgi:hypothetical protein